MKDGLTLRNNAKADLMAIKSIEDGVTYLNKLESVAIWVMKEKKDAELSNLVAEQKLRTQRILGELIKSGQESGEIKTPQSTLRHGPVLPDSENGKTLPDIGISHNKSAAFQAIAEIPEPDFEQFIEEKKAKVNEAVKELTTAGAVRLSKSLKEKAQDLDTLQDVNAELDMERELRDLAGELRKKYNREQIEKLIKFLTK